MISQANNITKLTYLKNKKVLLNESEVMDLETGEVMHKLEIKIQPICFVQELLLCYFENKL